MDGQQLRTEIVRPALTALGLWSPTAERLVMGTAAHESAGFRYVRQLGGGPALSLWQIEPATYLDLMTNTLPGLRIDLRAKFADLFARPARPYPEPEALVRDLFLGAAVCRLLYYRHPDPIPDTLEGQAAMWKKLYNTPRGAGTAEEYIAHFRAFCGWDL